TPDTQRWEYHEPFKTILFVTSLLLLGSLLVISLYWTFGPTPMLLLDATGLVYRPLPFVTYAFRWAEVQGITVLKPTSTRLLLFRGVTLTLNVTINPQAASRYRDKSPLRLIFSQTLLAMPMDELATLVQQQHMLHKVGFSYQVTSGT